MTEHHSLERTTGPSGWTEIAGLVHQLEGWELFENDPDNPNNCRGWIRTGDDSPKIKTKAKLRLNLTGEDGAERVMDVSIVHISSSSPLWEFVAT